MAVHKIGGNLFLALRGQVVPPSQRVVPVERPGVDGAGFLFLGRLPEPFTLRSQVDCQSLIDGQLRFDSYLELKDADGVELIKDSLAYLEAPRPWMVKVVDVQLVTLRAIIGMVGGLHWPSLAWLEADWTLVPVEVS